MAAGGRGGAGAGAEHGQERAMGGVCAPRAVGNGRCPDCAAVNTLAPLAALLQDGPRARLDGRPRRLRVPSHSCTGRYNNLKVKT